MGDKLKIIGLKVDGLRKLTAIEMEFAEKGLIQIRGKNGQGKTSILDSFEILLKGAKHIEDDMITHDRKKAEIIGIIGDYEIKRVITAKSNRIEVKHKDEGAMARPQEFLDTLINELTFNPRPFLNKTPEQKLRFMMDFLDIDFTAVDGKIKNAEEERLVVGRLIKRYGDLKPVPKTERVSISSLIQQKNDRLEENRRLKKEYDEERDRKLKDIRDFNEAQKKYKNNIDITQKRLADLDKEKKRLEKELEEVLVEHKQTSDLLVTSPQPEPEKSEEIKLEMPDLPDTFDIDEQIQQAEETNLQAAEYETYCGKKKEKTEEEAKYQAYTDKLETFRNAKKMILRNAKIPIEGLEIREDGVYYNGIQSENWAESDALKISSKLCLAMKPKLQALFLDEGECFDSDSIEELKNWAEDNDLQFFLTIVDSSENKSADNIFYIVDGAVA